MKTQQHPIVLIKERAKEEGISQEAIAKSLGARQGRISRWFGKETPHSLITLNRLAKAVGAELRIELVPIKKKKTKRRKKK